MEAPSDAIYRSNGWTTLRRVVESLTRVEGIQHADARASSSAGGIEIVGVLMVNEESGLTPESLMERIVKTTPDIDCPDRILLSYERPGQQIERRAA
jgi:hypothetical protein